MIPKVLYRYALVGIGSNFAVYLIFVALIGIGITPLRSAGICYLIGLTLSYFLNRHWSFESTANHPSDLVRFLFAYGIGFFANLVFITILTSIVKPEIAQILNIGLTAVVIYACLKSTGFGKGDR